MKVVYKSELTQGANSLKNLVKQFSIHSTWALVGCIAKTAIQVKICVASRKICEAFSQLEHYTKFNASCSVHLCF